MADVYLYIYDLSRGLSRVLSQAIVGQQFDGIWHTGVVVSGVEYFFGSDGICNCRAGTLPIGQPSERQLMGRTNLSVAELQDYLNLLSNSTFKEGTYNLFSHNCNTFSAHLVRYLTGNSIPEYITSLPSAFLQTPLGATLRIFLESGANFNGPTVNKVSRETNNNRNEYGAIFSKLKPVMFDEPHSSELSSESLDILFLDCKSGLAGQWTVETRSKLRLLMCDELFIESCSPDNHSLLKFNRHSTFKQCEVICEIFRLAAWRFPELVFALLTDPNQSLHELADTYPLEKGKTSRTEYFSLDASKARLLSNCIATGNEFHGQFMPLQPVVRLCDRLIRFEDNMSNLSFRTPEHESVGLALTMNLALCTHLQDNEALELAASLFYLVQLKKSFKNPIEASYILRTIFALCKRFENIKDLARSLGVGRYIGNLMDQAENIPDSGPTDQSVNIDKQITIELHSMLA